MSTLTPAATFPVTSPFNVAATLNGVSTPNAGYSGTFIPALWAAKLNAKFYASTIFGEIANTDWEGEIKNVGDKVIINNIPSITVADYDVGVGGAGLSYEVPVSDAIEMIVDKGKYFAFQVNDVLAHQAKPELMNLFTDDAAEQMKVEMDRSVVYGVYDKGHADNKGATAGTRSGSFNLGVDATPVTLTGSNILETLTAMAAVLDEQNVPETGRWIVIDPATRQLLMQSNLAQAQFMGDSSSMVRNGRIGQIDRFTVYVSNQLPTGDAGRTWKLADLTDSVGTTEVKRRALIAGQSTAITFASQMNKVETLRNPNDFGDYCRGLNVYGYKVVKPESLVLAVVA